MQYDKPFLSYPEMIRLMENRGIVFNNKDKAIDIISRVSYYSLMNGYQSALPFASGQKINFNELYSLYLIDRQLNNVLLRHILTIESHLKSCISYIISEKYGVHTCFSGPHAIYDKSSDYLNLKHYSNSQHKRSSTICQLRKVLDINDKSFHHSDSLVHYHHTHNHIPPWILTTSIPFGLANLWYSVLKSEDKSYVCDRMVVSNSIALEKKKEFLQISLSALRDYRNCIAHSGRTFNYSGRKILPKAQLVSLSDNLLCETDYMKSPSSQCGLHAIVTSIYIYLNNLERISLYKDLYLIFSDYIENGILIFNQPVLELFGLPFNFLDIIASLITDIN